MYLATGTLSAGAAPTTSGEQAISVGAALLWLGGNIVQWLVVLVVQVLFALIIPQRSSARAWPTPISSPSRSGTVACSSQWASVVWRWGRSRRSTAR